MKQVKIALVRFYNAKFIKLEDREEIVWRHEYKGMQVVSRLSKTTSFTTWGPVRLYPTNEKKSSSANTFVHLGPEKYPADLYTEVIVYRMIDVTEHEYELIQFESLEERGKLLKRFDEFEPVMQRAIEYCAGMLGIRVNPELVSIPIFDVDQRYLFINDRIYAVQGGFILQVRSEVNVIHVGDTAIQHSLDTLKLQKHDVVEKATESLGWLLRGWSAEDYVLRFISFFTALEFIIPGKLLIDPTSFKSTREKLIDLINQSNLKNDLPAERYDLFLFRDPPNVSLSIRFEMFARDANLYDLEKDIDDFRNYHKIRNALLHKGDSMIGRSNYVENETLINLERFVQKYVRFILYGIREEIPSNTRKKTVIRSAGNFLVEN
ncbi:MAG TPA: hypothetical protein VF487_01695 [Chitinophagaceae bacterium]